MRTKPDHARKLKVVIMKTSTADKKEVSLMAKERGMSMSEYFRELIRAEKERLKFKPYINRIEHMNKELQEKLDAVERCIRVMN